MSPSRPSPRRTSRLVEHAEPGTTVHLSQAEGDFVLPDRVLDHVLLISAGPGSREPWRPDYLGNPLYATLLMLGFEWGMARHDLEVDRQPVPPDRAPPLPRHPGPALPGDRGGRARDL